MASTTLQQTNWTGGEFSPRLLGQTDLERYFSAAQRIKNFGVHPQGGAFFRPGTHYVADAKNNDKKCVLWPFIFSVTQAYIIEVGDQYMRFYRDQIQIDSGGPVEIATPYLEAELEQIKFTQSADTMYITHPNHQPRKLTRSSHTSWTLTPITFTPATFNSTDNYPRAVTLYEQRSVWAGTNDDPQKIWFSKVGLFENLTTGTGDDDALEFTIDADEVNTILWMSPGDTLIFGTEGGIWEGHGASPNVPITPTSKQFNRQLRRKVGNIQAVRLASGLIYAQRSLKRSRQLFFNADRNAFDDPSASDVSEHLSRQELREMQFAQEPDGIVFSSTQSGNLLGMTFDLHQNVLAWFEWQFGGTDAKCESVAVIPATNAADGDEVWVAISRTVGGVTVRTVEYFHTQFDEQTDSLEDAFYVDSGLSYDGVPITTVSGLTHLEGETVAILADGSPKPRQAVQAGQITLTEAASKIHVGLPYQGELRTVPFEAESIGGTAGRKARAHEAVFRFKNAGGGEIQANANDPTAKLRNIIFRKGSDPLSTAVPLFTGEKVEELGNDYENGFEFTIFQNEPLPMEVLSVVIKGSVYG